MSRDMACRLCIPSVPYICAFHQCLPSACAYFRGCGTHRPTLSWEKGGGGAFATCALLPAPATCAFHVRILGLRNPGVPKGREIRAPICDPSSSWRQYANQSHAPAGCGVNLKEAGADKKGLHTARNASLWWQRRPHVLRRACAHRVGSLPPPLTTVRSTPRNVCRNAPPVAPRCRPAAPLIGSVGSCSARDLRHRRIMCCARVAVAAVW
jgi:hypothetical protein